MQMNLFTKQKWINWLQKQTMVIKGEEEGEVK